MNAAQLSPSYVSAHEFVQSTRALDRVHTELNSRRGDEDKRTAVCEFVVRVPTNDPSHFATAIQALHLSLEASILIVEAAREQNPTRLEDPDEFKAWADKALAAWVTEEETWSRRGELLETTLLWYGSGNWKGLLNPRTVVPLVTVAAVAELAQAIMDALVDHDVLANTTGTITGGAITIGASVIQTIAASLSSRLPDDTAVSTELHTGSVSYFAVVAPTGSTVDARRLVTVLRISGLDLRNIFFCSGTAGARKEGREERTGDRCGLGREGERLGQLGLELDGGQAAEGVLGSLPVILPLDPDDDGEPQILPGGPP
ncbi:hypothetical protein, partial [Microbacterium gubbeenense]|uniref:hypothetical protein n=1 Tax=Microbacterium gubbeenense TaxID=159896 RepID=UPI003CCC4664